MKAVTSRIEDRFALPSAEDFRKAITPKTKAILICNPNNPTGYLYSPEELFQLRDLVKEYDLFLIADEVYREFVYTDEPYVSALTAVRHRGQCHSSRLCIKEILRVRNQNRHGRHTQ